MKKNNCLFPPPPVCREESWPGSDAASLGLQPGGSHAAREEGLANGDGGGGYGDMNDATHDDGNEANDDNLPHLVGKMADSS